MIPSDFVTIAVLVAIGATSLITWATVTFFSKRNRQRRAFDKKFDKSFGHIINPKPFRRDE